MSLPVTLYVYSKTKIYKKHIFQNPQSVIIVQQLFCMHFNIGDTVPGCIKILRCVHILQETASIVKKKQPGPNKTAKTLGNIVRVR